MRIQLNEKLSCDKEKNAKDQTKNNNINIFEQVHKEFASLLARNKQHLSESKEQEKGDYLLGSVNMFTCLTSSSKRRIIQVEVVDDSE
jgi:hypothetical protein